LTFISVSITFTLLGNTYMKNKGKHIAGEKRLNLSGFYGYVLILIFFFQVVLAFPAQFFNQHIAFEEGAKIQTSHGHDNHDIPFNAEENEAEIPISDIDELINSPFSDDCEQDLSNMEMAYQVHAALMLNTISTPTPPPDISI
jgi:hypothetical protein